LRLSLACRPGRRGLAKCLAAMSLRLPPRVESLLRRVRPSTWQLPSPRSTPDSSRSLPALPATAGGPPLLGLPRLVFLRCSPLLRGPRLLAPASLCCRSSRGPQAAGGPRASCRMRLRGWFLPRTLNALARSPAQTASCWLPRPHGLAACGFFCAWPSAGCSARWGNWVLAACRLCACLRHHASSGRLSACAVQPARQLRPAGLCPPRPPASIAAKVRPLPECHYAICYPPTLDPCPCRPGSRVPLRIDAFGPVLVRCAYLAPPLGLCCTLAHSFLRALPQLSPAARLVRALLCPGRPSAGVAC